MINGTLATLLNTYSPGINWLRLAAGVTRQKQKEEKKDTAD
jgi:hypothetical protein